MTKPITTKIKRPNLTRYAVVYPTPFGPHVEREFETLLDAERWCMDARERYNPNKPGPRVRMLVNGRLS